MAQGVDTSNLEAAQKKYDELKQPYDKLVEQRGAIRDEQQRLYEETLRTAETIIQWRAYRLVKGEKGVGSPVETSQLSIMRDPRRSAARHM